MERVEKEDRERFVWALGFFLCCIVAINILPWNDDSTGRLQRESKNSKDLFVLDLEAWVERVRSSGIRPIIFVESSLRSTLSVRQSCAVESAARWNPDAHVLLVMTTPPDETHPLVRMLREKFSVHVLYADPRHVFSGSPLERWYKSWTLHNPDFRTVHLSDAMRLVLLWHLGGIYLDLDVVVRRPLDVLDDAIVTESEDYLCNAVMAFRAGHGFVTECLEDFARNYSGETWIANGPLLVTRVAHRYCGVDHTDLVNAAPCDLNVLPPETGYSLKWQKWQWFFQPERARQVMDMYNSSLLVHMWNSQSFRWKARVGSGSAFDLLFANNCPSSYGRAVDGVF